jgi:protein-disulfide isomerase
MPMETQLKQLISIVSTLIALQIFTLLVVAGGGLYILSDLKQHMSAVASAGSRPSVPQQVEEWQTLIREHNAGQGSETAELIVIEFSDFQCPFCKRHTDSARRELREFYGDDVRMVFKHLPLEIHAQAMTAAIAAQCARREGKFWEVHERFFAQPEALDVDSLIAVGESVGLGQGYSDCIRNEETRDEVERDIGDAALVGIQGTPTFVINGKVLVGAQAPAAFSAALEQAGAQTD